MRPFRGVVLVVAVSVAALGVAASAGADEAVITIDGIATFDRATGGAVVTGTIECSATDDVVYGSFLVDASQRVGRVSTVIGNGSGYPLPTCTGEPASWSVTVAPTNGQFKGGVATVSARLFLALASGGPVQGSAAATVRLRG